MRKMLNEAGILMMTIFVRKNFLDTKLYEWHTINGGWNGLTASGIAAAEGTYYYIIKATMIDGKDYSKQGFFSLQR